MTTTTDSPRHPGDRYIGQAITPELLRAEATRLDATNAGGAASWIMGEVAALLRLTADQAEEAFAADDPFADWPAADIDPQPTDVWDLCRQWDQEANAR
jgi:hypothetical protein